MGSLQAIVSSPVTRGAKAPVALAVGLSASCFYRVPAPWVPSAVCRSFFSAFLSRVERTESAICCWLRRVSGFRLSRGYEVLSAGISGASRVPFFRFFRDAA